MYTQLNRNSNLQSEDQSAGKKEAENASHPFTDNRPEALQLKKIREGAVTSSLATPIAQLQQNLQPVQLVRDRDEVEEEDSGKPVQRVVDPSVPMNSRIRIDRPTASDYGDTGTIIRPSTVEKYCMAVEFDNEKGTLYRVFLNEMVLADGGAAASSVPFDRRFPQLTFTLNQEKTEDIGEDVYDVTGPGLDNPTSVTKEGKDYYSTENNEKWNPSIGGKALGLEARLEAALGVIAQENRGKNCHIVATKMEKAFQDAGIDPEVMEIYSEDGIDGNHIQIMGARVRNHYATYADGKTYDSGTGSLGMSWSAFFAQYQQENPGRVLKFRKAAHIE